VAVYRLHSLLPDRVALREAATGRVAAELALTDLLFSSGAAANVGTPAEDVLFTLGAGRAGALELGNYPEALRALRLPGGQLVDLAAADVFRSREVGVAGAGFGVFGGYGEGRWCGWGSGVTERKAGLRHHHQQPPKNTAETPNPQRISSTADPESSASNCPQTPDKPP
jgi:hypothetical protein